MRVNAEEAKKHNLKSLIPRDDNEQYHTCVFGQHKMKNECLALNMPYCCTEKCSFYKNKDEYVRDRYTGYVHRRGEEAEKRLV